MNNQYPIYTLKNECVDCYKCVRQCSMKAIRIENGHASVIPERQRKEFLSLLLQAGQDFGTAVRKNLLPL